MAAVPRGGGEQELDSAAVGARVSPVAKRGRAGAGGESGESSAWWRACVRSAARISATWSLRLSIFGMPLYASKCSSSCVTACQNGTKHHVGRSACSRRRGSCQVTACGP